MTEKAPESWHEVIYGVDASEDGILAWYREFYSGKSDKELETLQHEFSQNVGRGYRDMPSYSDGGWYRDDHPATMKRQRELLAIVSEILEARAKEQTVTIAPAV